MNLSPAHQASAAFVLDPAYSADSIHPSPDELVERPPWIYGNGQLEAWKIEQLVNAGFAAARNVHYLRNYGVVVRKSYFRCPFPDGAETVPAIRSNARITVERVPGYLHVAAESDEPAALLLEEDLLGSTWEWSRDGAHWEPVSFFPQLRSGVLPHSREEPRIVLQPVRGEGGVYDFGATMLGRPIFRCDGTPRLTTGESPAEALAPDSQLEANHELEQLPDGRWTSRHLLGFRYLQVEPSCSEVIAEACAHPAQYRGAFACSDDLLTRIWMNSAFTLRTCMHHLMLDGVKRDRMPWVGDQASNLLVNAYTFAESNIIKRSLTALGRPTGGYINGIVDYSLWWVINQRQYQRYFDDLPYLRGELRSVNALLDDLVGQTDAEGLLRPPADSWIFIDWGLQIDKTRTCTALQILWQWALRSGAELNAKCGDHDREAQWQSRADALATHLHSVAWNSDAQAWQEYLEGDGTDSPYPNFLAALSGLSGREQYLGIRENLIRNPARGTPFMTGFALMALARVGGGELVPERLREYWGGMLKRGATTFWEEFKVGESDCHAMYGRPFGRSLCHAWSSGPAAILSAEIAGVRPLQDGWREFSVEPALGELDWLQVTVPTPKGEIQVVAEKGGVEVVVPEGTRLIHADKQWCGPTVVRV